VNVNRALKTIGLLFFGFASHVSARADDLRRASSFESVAAFVSAVKAFHPANSKTDMAKLFTVPELGQPEDPNTGKPVVAASVDSCKLVWEGETHSLVFAAASPDTEATRSVVGVLFLLVRSHDRWTIADLNRFTATGKYAAVTSELTASAGVGYKLSGSDDLRPIVTIKEEQGGRGYGYLVSASFTLAGNRLKRLDLE
jgi:hypothetical protein